MMTSLMIFRQMRVLIVVFLIILHSFEIPTSKIRVLKPQTANIGAINVWNLVENLFNYIINGNYEQKFVEKKFIVINEIVRNSTTFY